MRLKSSYQRYWIREVDVMLTMKYKERKGIWVIKTDDLDELFEHLKNDIMADDGDI